MRLYFGQNGLVPKEIHFSFDKPLDEITDEESYIRS